MTTITMNVNDVIKLLQQHFSDGLVLIIGSGLSAAEGIPGMPELATHLEACSTELTKCDLSLWQQITNRLQAKTGLEAALHEHQPSDTLEAWIVKKTCALILPKESEVIQAVLRSDKILRLTEFLSKILKPANGLPILTPNYDRLIEVGCEMAGFHVDTTAIGHYAGTFDHTRSCMGSCRGIIQRGKTTLLDHFARAVVLKPHGSLDWYKGHRGIFRSALELGEERLIITPGRNKYKAGYNVPFDKHRELANNYINSASRFLVIGYGFNDDHLQQHLIPRIRNGTPTVILTKTASEAATKLATESPHCFCLSRPESHSGTIIVSRGISLEQKEKDLWDLGVLAREILI